MVHTLHTVTILSLYRHRAIVYSFRHTHPSHPMVLWVSSELVVMLVAIHLRTYIYPLSLLG